MAFAVSVHAEPARYIKPDPYSPNEYRIFNRDGKQTGVIKQERWEPGKLNVNRDGKQTGTIKKDRWEPDTYQILDTSGEQMGTVKKDR